MEQQTMAATGRCRCTVLPQDEHNMHQKPPNPAYYPIVMLRLFFQRRNIAANSPSWPFNVAQYYTILTLWSDCRVVLSDHWQQASRVYRLLGNASGIVYACVGVSLRRTCSLLHILLSAVRTVKLCGRRRCRRCCFCRDIVSYTAVGNR